MCFQARSVTWLSPLQQRQRAIARWSLVPCFMAGNRGRKGCFDFLKLPALSLDLTKKYSAQDFEGIHALFGLSDADLNCRV